MNIADELAQIVRTAPIADMDMGFLQQLNPAKAYEGLEAKEGYKTLVWALIKYYEGAVEKGMPKERTAAVVLGAHEDLLRYVIGKAIKDRMSHMSPQEIGVVNLERKLAELTVEIDKAEGAIIALQAKRKKEVEEGKIESFRYSLQYAGERWGSTTEKRAIASLVKKIVSEPKADAKKAEAH